MTTYTTYDRVIDMYLTGHSDQQIADAIGVDVDDVVEVIDSLCEAM